MIQPGNVSMDALREMFFKHLISRDEEVEWCPRLYE